MKTKVIDFLKNKIEASADRLVKAIAEKLSAIKPNSSDNAVLAIMAKSAVTVLAALGMQDAVQFLSLLFTSSFGEKGMAVPEEIEKLFVATKPVVAPTLTPSPKPTQTSAPAQQSAKPATAPPQSSSASPKPAGTGPVRKLEGPLANWIGNLDAIVAGVNCDLKQIGKQTTSVFRNKSLTSQISPSDWELFFAALMKVNKSGGHILSNQADPYAIFKMAPAKLVDELVFTKDGLFDSLSAQVAENKDEEFPIWLSAKASIVVDAIAALEDSTEFRLGRSDYDRTIDLFAKINQRKGVVEWLIEKMTSLFPQIQGEISEEIEAVHEKAKVANPSMADGLAGLKIETPSEPVLQ